MLARFDENPAMTLQVIKETQRYGRTDSRTQRENSIPTLKQRLRGTIYAYTKALLGKNCLSFHRCHFVKKYFF